MGMGNLDSEVQNGVSEELKIEWYGWEGATVKLILEQTITVLKASKHVKVGMVPNINHSTLNATIN